MKISSWCTSSQHLGLEAFKVAKRFLKPLIRKREAGMNFSRLSVDGLRSGITTCEQAAEKLGAPFGVSSDVEGKRLATWCYAGHGGAKAVTIAFSDEGVMEGVVTFCEIHPSWDEKCPKLRSSRGSWR